MANTETESLSHLAQLGAGLTVDATVYTPAQLVHLALMMKNANKNATLTVKSAKSLSIQILSNIVQQYPGGVVLDLS